MDVTNISQFLAFFFAGNFYYFTPKIANFGHIQLGILANIVSKIVKYHFPKLYAFVKKLTIDVIFRWL